MRNHADPRTINTKWPNQIVKWHHTCKHMTDGHFYATAFNRDVFVMPRSTVGASSDATIRPSVGLSVPYAPSAKTVHFPACVY